MVITETPRLILRPFTHFDVEDMSQVMGNQEVMKYSVKGPLSVKQTQDFVESILENYDRKGFGLWAMEDKTTGSVIGYCGYYFPVIDGKEEIELGFRVARSQWSKGLATEAAKATVHHAFTTLKLPRLISIIEAENLKSIRVAEKCGLTYTRDTTYHNIPVRIYNIEVQKYLLSIKKYKIETG